jgi:hypothetical protein
MKKNTFLGILTSALFLGFFLMIHCGKDNPASPGKTPSQLNREVAGVWRFSLDWNPDTTFHIVLTYDSGYFYKINVNINDVDTMERENGTWFIKSDTVAHADTVWMQRENCHQINLTTHTLDTIKCSVDTAGIKINISRPDTQTIWVIPLNDFIKYLPPDIVPPGFTLPPGQFIKD